MQTRLTNKESVLAWTAAIFSSSFLIMLCSDVWTGMENRTAEAASTPILSTLASTKSAINKITTAPAESIATMKVGDEHCAVQFAAAGTVEANQNKVQDITPLVSGRVEDIFVSVGTSVKKGDLLVRIESPQVAELHGKLHEAQTRLKLANEQLNRIQQNAYKVNLLKAKVSLDEADATLKRNRQLMQEGLVPQKEIVSSESDYSRAQADYEYQKNISLNQEVSQATAEVQNAKTELEHYNDALRALDAKIDSATESHEHDISLVELRAPIAGTVIERSVNPGSGVDVAKSLLTIADTSAVCVVANVPAKQICDISAGMPVKIKMERQTLNGKVSYIDPRINEQTNTGKVRIDIDKHSDKVAAGASVEVLFSKQDSHNLGNVFIPDSCIYSAGGNSFVFVKQGNSFIKRKVELGDHCFDMISVCSGLSKDEELACDPSSLEKSKLFRQAEAKKPS